jgi:hypothetical protein
MKFNIFTQNPCIDLVGSNWGYEILKPFFKIKLMSCLKFVIYLSLTNILIILIEFFLFP